MEETRYDNANPPPETIVISRETYDRVKLDIAKSMDLHRALRKAAPLIYGQDISEEELKDIRMHFDHFYQMYPDGSFTPQA